MIEPKAQVFAQITKLKTTYPNLKVLQERQKDGTIPDFPAITFRIEDDRPAHTLDKDIPYQRIVARIDIWTNTSKESGKLLLALESKMKEIDYLLSTHFDILDQGKGEKYSHVTTQFIY